MCVRDEEGVEWEGKGGEREKVVCVSGVSGVCCVCCVVPCVVCCIVCCAR